MGKSVILFFVILGLWVSGQAQIKSYKIKGGCALDEVPLPSTIVTDDIDEPTKEMFRTLTRTIGIQASFTIRKADVKNAMVTLGENNERLLLINPDFVTQLKGFSTDWGVYFVLAHEIAHFLNGDALVHEKHTPEMEIAADKFAAVTLCRMGAKLNDATNVLELLLVDKPSSGYPTKAQRLFGVKSGWLDANCDNSHSLTYNAVTNRAIWQYAGKGYQLNMGAQNMSDYYKVCIQILASELELKRIESVRYYFLHDSFGAGGSSGKIYTTSTDAASNFQHCITIWGTFPLRIVINYKEGKQKQIDYVW